jgi:hypothetical protein
MEYVRHNDDIFMIFTQENTQQHINIIQRITSINNLYT